MNILFCTRKFYPEIGGVEKHVLKISEQLITQGHTVTILAESFRPSRVGNHHPIIRKSQKQYMNANIRVIDEDLDESIESLCQEMKVSQHRTNKRKRPRYSIPANITVIRMPRFPDKWSKKFNIWMWLWKYRSLIKYSDVIHCHDVFYWYMPFRFIYWRKPVYTTFHGYEMYPIPKKNIIVRKISEKLSWGNICIGDFIKKWYGTKPTFTSYGGVDNAKFQPEADQPLADKVNPSGSLRTRSSKFKKESAVFIGRLDEQTNVLTYVKAFEQIQKKLQNFELLIVGDGIFRKQIEKKLKVLGFQDNPERFFDQYHFAFVSRYLSILEAFAAKKLVFAVYDNPLKEDYLRMSPFAKFMIIEKSPIKLAEQVEYFLRNPNKEKQLTSKAFKWVQKQSWNEMVRIYLQLWKN